jgi:hypothetical protein
VSFSVGWSNLHVSTAEIEAAQATVATKLQDAQTKRADAHAAKAAKEKETLEAKAAAKAR